MKNSGRDFKKAINNLYGKIIIRSTLIGINLLMILKYIKILVSRFGKEI